MIQRLSEKDVVRGIVRLAAFSWIAAAAVLTSGCVSMHDEDKDKQPEKIIVKEKDTPPTTTDRVIIEEHKNP